MTHIIDVPGYGFANWTYGEKIVTSEGDRTITIGTKAPVPLSEMLAILSVLIGFPGEREVEPKLTSSTIVTDDGKVIEATFILRRKAVDAGGCAE